jgi:hypothetical protein
MTMAVLRDKMAHMCLRKNENGKMFAKINFFCQHLRKKRETINDMYMRENERIYSFANEMENQLLHFAKKGGRKHFRFNPTACSV